MSLLDRLNPKQREAVTTTEGRVLILAGAGSGKTLVLTTRMAHLVKNCGVSPSQILGLTFTNKAAQEMQERIALLTEKPIAKKITLCTFHSLCLRILRKHIHLLGYTSAFSIYDEKDLERLIQGIAKDLLKQENALPSLRPTINLLQKARMEGLAPEDIQDEESPWHTEFTQKLYRKLRTLLKAYNAVDFDDLLLLTVELFKRFPDVLDLYQERFRYIMIDEYQDTNPIQYRLATLLTSKYQNLCVVGDDDQSIYGWRGACIHHILEFPYDKKITLEQNYRSTNTILHTANALIDHNTTRHKKTLWSDRSDSSPIEVFHAPTELKEVEAVVYRLCKLKEQKNLQWKDFAILYRSNALSKHFEMALNKQVWKEGERWIRGIPYKVFGGTEFLFRKEVQDTLAYLRVLSNPHNQEALLRIINYPRRGIGAQSLDLLTSYNREKEIPLWKVLEDLDNLPLSLPEQAKQSLKSFVQLIKEGQDLLNHNSLGNSLELFLEKLRLKDTLEKEHKSQKLFLMKWENIEELISSLVEFEKSSPSASLEDFLSETALDQESRLKKKSDKGSTNFVHLMTFHSAKGLEFPACFLVGVEDHIIPHQRSMKETGEEEERRLMYVAVTRAKSHLTISMSQARRRMGKVHPSRPSRFLFEIPKNLLSLSSWDAS